MGRRFALLIAAVALVPAGGARADDEAVASVVGRVLDADGKPLPGVTVGIAEVNKDFPMWDVVRRTTTDADGRFAMPPLKASGEYDLCPLPEIEVAEGKRIVLQPRPLPGTFLVREVVVRADGKPPEVELKAVPHVTFTARFVDGIGMPTVAGRGYTARGKLGKAAWSGVFVPVDGRPDAFTALVPLGLKDLTVDADWDSVMWAWFPGSARVSFGSIRLAKVDADRPDIVAQRFRSGSLEIRLKVAAGELPAEPEVSVMFPRKDGGDGGPYPDRVAPGVYRIDRGLLPGRAASVWVRADGFKNLMTRGFQLTEEGQKAVVELTLVPGERTARFATKDAVPVTLTTPEGVPIAQPSDAGRAKRAIACRAVDKETGRPVADAAVNFQVEASKDEEGQDEHGTFDRAETRTDADGRFTVLVAERYLPDPAPKRQLSVRVTIHRPGYLNYWDTANTREIVERGVSDRFPEFRAVKLVPAREVFGRLLGPDGQPLPGVTIYKRYDMTNLDDYPRDSDFPETDADGRFRFNVPAKTGFKAEFRAARVAENLFDFRADQTDLGDVRLSRGARIAGRIVDAAGKPIHYISLTARLATAPPPMSITSYETNENGHYETSDLAPGKYLVQVGDIFKDEDGKSTVIALKDAPGVYIARTVELKRDGQPATDVDFRPAEQVLFTARLTTTKPQPKPEDDKPGKGEELTDNERAGRALLEAFSFIPLFSVRGKIEGVEWANPLSWAAAEVPNSYTRPIPKGLTDATLELSFMVQRFRLRPDGPELFGPAYRLGRVDAGLPEIQFRRYATTILKPRFGPPGSKPPDGLKIEARYVREPEMIALGVLFQDPTPTPIGAGATLIYSVLPDEEVELTATAPGLAPTSARVKLVEGETREVRLGP